MESATEMLFSKANQNAELAKESSKEIPKEISEVPEKDKIQNELKNNITSVESGINSISLNAQEEQNKNPEKTEKNNIQITTFNSVNDFFFPIVNNKIQEESKNPESNIISTSSKEIQEKSINDFTSIDLKIPENIRSKSNISTISAQTQNRNLTPNIPLNPGQMYVPNYFVYPNSLTKKYFGPDFLNNYNLAHFVPVTFSCSIDTHKGPRSQNRTKEEEKAFFEKIIKIGDASNVSEFWQIFQHLKKPNQCPIGADYHLFKKGIIPMWEDDMNKNGGKLSVLLTWKYSNVIWEESAFNFAKGLLPHFEYINGIVISMRQKFAVLSFWIKTNTNSAVEQIRNALSGILQAPSPNCIDFIAFN